jgi:hypothetical protein
MDTLHDDLRALKACSLTCKSMFASTRHLIHQSLHLPLQSPTSHSALFHYVRRAHLRTYSSFLPSTLLPYLRHFQSLDRVHTLTIDCYRAGEWAWGNQHRTCFVHLYPTLTSLKLHHPFGHHRLLLQFVLQFPNLENLCLEWLGSVNDNWVPDLTDPTIVDQFPPLRGHLRLAGNFAAAQWPVEFTRELSNGINFRSAELEDFSGSPAQNILNGCGHALEDLTIVTHAHGTHRPFSPSLTTVDRLAPYLFFQHGGYSWGSTGSLEPGFFVGWLSA